MTYAGVLALFSIDPSVIQPFAVVTMTLLPIILAVSLAILILPSWFICKKAGFSPWMSFVNVVPFGTLFLMYLLAFAEWKVDEISHSAS
jgi:hypothetical protein